LSTKPGSLVQRAVIATGAAIRAGWSRLAALVAGDIAAYGPDFCWVTDGAHAEQIVQRNGKHPHPGSVARVRRALAAAGVVRAKRIFAGQRIAPQAKHTSSHGVVRCTLNWDRLGVLDPLRGAKRHEQQQPRGPRHISAVRPDEGAALAEFQRLAQGAIDSEQQRIHKRQADEDFASYESATRKRPPGRPPD